VRTGLGAILPSDATHVLFLDADLQHDPEEIPKLVQAARDGAGVLHQAPHEPPDDRGE